MGFTGFAKPLVRPIARKVGLSEDEAARLMVANFGAGIAQGIVGATLGPFVKKVVLEFMGGLALTLGALFIDRIGEDTRKDMLYLGIRLLSDVPNVTVGELASMKATADRIVQLAKAGRIKEAVMAAIQRPFHYEEVKASKPVVAKPVESVGASEGYTV